MRILIPFIRFQVPASKRAAGALAASLALLVVGLAAPFRTCDAAGPSFVNLIPSTRYITLSSPWRPTSSAECSALAQEFAQIISELNQQHEECLQDAPRDDPNGGGTCSKATCQPLHSAKDSASRKASEESRVCQQRVSEYLAAQRKAQEEQQRAEREEAEAKARRDAQRQKDDRERDARASQRDRERLDREARDAQEKRDRARSDQEARNQRDREAGERARRDQERAAQAERDARNLDARIRAEIAIAEMRQRAAEAKQKRDAEEQSTYVKLTEQLKAAKEAGDTALEFAKNPFRKSTEMVADKVASALVDKGLDIAAPIGPEGHDATYDRIAGAADAARDKALSGNPFANTISGKAMEGVNKIHRQVIGQMDQVTKGMDSIGRDDSARSTVASSTFRASPAPQPMPATSNPRGTTAQTDNPFATPSAGTTRRPDPPERVAMATPSNRPSSGAASGDTDSSSPVAARSNPFDRGAAPAAGVYYDPESKQRLTVPSGHVLFRDPRTRTLQVLPANSVDASAGDGNGNCTTTGIGIVVPSCEEARRKSANPFGPKAAK